MITLLGLNEYCLAEVFAYLEIKDLINLSMSCKTFSVIIHHYLRPIINKKLMVCNSQRSPQKFTSLNLVKINRNWLEGRYKERITFKHKPLFFCHIQLEKDQLLKSHGSEIRTYRREPDGYLNEKPELFIDCKQQADITYFVKRDDRIFAGLSNGCVLLYSMKDKSLLKERCYVDCEFITCVDYKEDVFVTTGKKKGKIFKLEEELGVQALELKYELPYIFQSCRFHPSLNRLALGKYSDREKRALCMVDIETGLLEEQLSCTGAIYDMLWRDENCIMTANFDSTIRLTDIRTKKDELIFSDIYNSSVYCLDFDGQYGVVCGMKYFRVNLYDIRVTKRFQQMYFPKRTSFNNSPVYSIQCDTSQLFVQTDTNLRILNFNCDYEKCRDFSNMNIYD